MGVGYKSVLWNKQKKKYDLILLAGILLYLLVFIGSNLIFFPQISLETLIIRSTGTLAILLLHFILMIGPLTRINKRFLPFLYNRRHFGVIMFLFATIHGGFSIIQYHSLGDVNPLVSLFTSNTNYSSWTDFPFQPLGFIALLILFVMAATSHDFWLKNLSPKFWKALHMLVYIAYVLLIMHVLLGVIQAESSPISVGLLGLGMFTVIGLHLYAAFNGDAGTIYPTENLDGFYKVCEIGEIEDDKAKMVLIDEENIAIFKYDNQLSAVHNVCKHQNGPLGEGKIVDGCIVCPWHGYQYQPQDGCSPPPFTEKICTFELKLVGTTIYVNPTAKPEGTYLEPLVISEK